MQKSLLTDALDKRFDDIEEIKDVADHGCDGGVSDFIYYSETCAFFDEYELEIEQNLDEYYGDCKQFYMDIFNNQTQCISSIRHLKNEAVWFVVQTYCQKKLEEHQVSNLISKLST